MPLPPLKPLRSRQRVALQALLMGKTQGQAAALAGVTIQCLRMWQHRANWKLEEARERYEYGLSDADLTRRVRRNLLVEANPAVERIKSISIGASSEKVKFQSNAYLVDKALRDERGTLGIVLPPEALQALAKGLAEAFLTPPPRAIEAEPRESTP